MTVNRALASLKGISKENINKINKIHNILEELILGSIVVGRDDVAVLDEIMDLEYQLQELWGYPLNSAFHTWRRRYLFKKQWAFTTWECQKTGERFTIPYDVEEIDYFKIGEGWIDVGRYNLYSRMSGVVLVE